MGLYLLFYNFYLTKSGKMFIFQEETLQELNFILLVLGVREFKAIKIF